jgi:hypothetical protein
MTTGPGNSPDERAERLLRAALESRAAQVEIAPDALSRIRARTARRAWWHRFAGGAMPLAFTTGAATAVAVTVTAVVFTAGSCAPPSPTTPSTPAGASSSAPTGGPTTTTTPTQGTGGTSANVPVYFTGNLNGAPKLYREYHQLKVGDGSAASQTKAAIAEMLDGRNAYDPDYITAWPASTAVRGVRINGDTVTVDLAGAAVNAYDPPSEKAALQQLIYTATAASKTSKMVLLLDGRPVAKLWNLLPTGGELARGPMVDYFAPVWIIDPQTDATVSGTVTVFAAGIVPEAQMRVRIRNASNQIVYDHGLLLSIGAPSQGTGTLKVAGLAPGTYTVEGFYYSLKDGSVQGTDNHTFTVR